MGEQLTREQIFERLSAILVKSFEIDPSQIELSSHIIDDLDLDSLDAIDLAVGLEDETGLELSEDELREIRLVKDVVELVYDRLQSR